jgi:putative transposase
MRYIELNMVRAGVVSHPDQWAWCSYQEWFGLRQRYCLIDQQSCLRVLGTGELSVFQGHFRRLIDETIEEDKCHREPQWTESIAVGSETFITKVREATEGRQRFTTERFAVDAWVLKELPPGPDLLRSKNRAKNRV